MTSLYLHGEGGDVTGTRVSYLKVDITVAECVRPTSEVAVFTSPRVLESFFLPCSVLSSLACKTYSGGLELPETVVVSSAFNRSAVTELVLNLLVEAESEKW